MINEVYYISAPWYSWWFDTLIFNCMQVMVLYAWMIFVVNKNLYSIGADLKFNSGWSILKRLIYSWVIYEAYDIF